MKPAVVNYGKPTCATCSVQTLKHALSGNGLSSVQVVVADGSWDVSNDILNNSSFAAAVDIIG